MTLLHIRRKNLRRSFGKTKEIVSLPDLIEVQSRSFNNFVQLDYLPNERENIGLEKVLRNTFPIEQGDRFSLNYNGYELGDWACVCGALTGIEKRYTWKSKSGKKTGVSRLSKEELDAGHYYVRCSTCHSRVSIKVPYTVDECVYGGRTYSMPLRLRLQLISWDVAEESTAPQIKDIKEQTVFICSLPIMIGVYEAEDGSIRVGDRGIFVINGVHRVVVSQIHRAPGVLFSIVKKAKGHGPLSSYNARIIPARGAWLDFEFDNNGILYVRIDKKKKVLVTTFLQALGVSREELLYKFYDVLKISADKGFYSVAVSESLCGLRIGSGFLSSLPSEDLLKQIGSDLGLKRGMRLSRDHVAKLLKHGIENLFVPKEALLGKSVVKKVVAANGEILLDSAAIISQPDLSLLDKLSKTEIEVLGDVSVGSSSSLVNTLAQDSVFDQVHAAKEIYNRIKPGDAPGAKAMEEYVQSMFFNAKYYDVSPVGRVRLNRKFEQNVPLNELALKLEDIIATVKYLLSLQEKGEGLIDDIDNLANRCVRLVDELLQMQVYLGFSRIEKIAKEKMRLVEGNLSHMPYDFINVKPMAAVLGAFFGTGQLSQFMEQTNPLAEMAHKRRLSALGQGGISRERATLDVRDVHPSHYGKLCMIETPDGHNIGLISSLSIYSKVNELGFIETVYRPVKNGVVQQNIVETLGAFEERNKVIAHASVPMDPSGKILQEKVFARKDGEIVSVSPEEIDFMDVSTRQLVSVSTALIPFLEHDDANRAQMGSNMQRQAVPLIAPRSPLIGTGVERDVASSEGVCLLAKNPGYVAYVSADKIIISLDRSTKGSLEEWALSNVDVYNLKKYGRSSHNTWLHYRPVVREGMRISKGDLLADGPAVDKGELALGNNICVAYMPWRGYNFEDAIVVSKRLVTDDLYTSVHIEEFVVEARDTKLGAEEITRDIPNISERDLSILDQDGIVKIGTRVSPGDILVAKATLKGDVQVSPEEKLLRAIFGDKSREVKDTSERVQNGVYGTVIDVRVFSRSGIRKDARYKDFVTKETAKIEALFKIKLTILEESYRREILEGIKNAESYEGLKLEELFSKFEKHPEKGALTSELKSLYVDKIKVLNAQKKDELSRLRRGDELPSGVLKMVRVYVAMKRPVSVGDKMAGRHGNKGVVSKVVDIQDMPHLEDGTPVDIVLNPLGVPSRMNLGQLLEATLGMVCNKFSKNLLADLQSLSRSQIRGQLNEYMGNNLVDELISEFGEDVLVDIAGLISKEGLKLSTPVFDGANFEREIVPMLDRLGLPNHGKFTLYDGRTGEKFMQKVTVGYTYMMKLNHMADDKLHARSVGPYSLITQQPLGGKTNFGGQRLGEMEVWALFGYGAAFTLREMSTLKSDDVVGRVKTFEAIVHGEEVCEPGLPESFNVLIKELQSLGLSVDLFQASEERFCE